MAMTKEERRPFGGFFPLDGTEYFDAPQPLVDGVIPQGEFTLMTGQPKVGKSTFAAHLTYSVATGEPFFGRQVWAQGTVIYLAMERAYQTQSRIYKLFELGERDPRNVILVKPQESSMKTLLFNGEADADGHTDVDRLIRRIEDAKLRAISLLVIDSLENTLAGSDSDSKDAGPWCDGLQRLLEHFETTALVLHHDNKASDGKPNSTSAYRGSSVFYARAGAWIRALARTNTVSLETQRGNFGADWSQTVGFNDFGLYTDSMPARGRAKQPTQIEFITARLIEHPLVSPSELRDIVLNHPGNQWPEMELAAISKALKPLGTKVVRHPHETDGRSCRLEYVG